LSLRAGLDPGAACIDNVGGGRMALETVGLLLLFLKTVDNGPFEAVRSLPTMPLGDVGTLLDVASEFTCGGESRDLGSMFAELLVDPEANASEGIE
jgi:hypothetical protein